jgi:phage gpG-like protein
MIEANQAEAHFNKVASRFMAPMNDIVDQCYRPVIQSIRDAFNSSASPYGSAWPPRKITGDGHPLLMDKGNLIQAATGGGPGHVHDVETTEGGGADLCVGVSLDVIPYARAQALGYSPRNLPARNFLGLSDQQADVCEKIISEGMEQRFDEQVTASSPIGV